MCRKPLWATSNSHSITRVGSAFVAVKRAHTLNPCLRILPSFLRPRRDRDERVLAVSSDYLSPSLPPLLLSCSVLVFNTPNGHPESIVLQVSFSKRRDLNVWNAPGIRELISNNDGDGYENVLKSKDALLQTFFIVSHSIRQMLAIFSGVEF